MGKLQRFGRFIARILLKLFGIVAYVLTTFILAVIIFRQEEAGYWVVSELLIASLFLIPFFIGLDQWVQRLLKIASGELPEVIDLSGEEKTKTDEVSPEAKKTSIKHFAPLIRKVFRFVLAALLFFIVLGLWGIDLSFGRIFAADALKIIMVVIIGFVVWEFAKSRIDQKLKE